MNSLTQPAGAKPNDHLVAESSPTPGPRLPRSGGGYFWLILACIVALMAIIPVATMILSWAAPDMATWSRIQKYLLWKLTVNSLLLALMTVSLAVVIGVACAWLVTMCRFPGSKILTWLLLLPMAVPAYLAAYAWTDLMEFSGPVQSTLREWFGWQTRRDYFFPEIRSLWGAAVLLGLSLYPYVFLLVRTALLQQSVCVLEAARSLGRGPWAAALRIALPLARPAIAAGAALVLMETLADYGTVDYFAVDTYTTGIYRAYHGYGSEAAAAQLGSVLLFVVVVLLGIERLARGRAKYHHTTGKWRDLPQWKLPSWKGFLALVVCLLPIVLGFLVPVVALISRAWRTEHHRVWETLSHHGMTSLQLALIGAGLTVVAALAVLTAGRLRPGWLQGLLARMSGLGYALPGSLIAIGIIIPIAWMDHRLDALLSWAFGSGSGLLLSGSMFVLIAAYVLRFLAVALGGVESGFSRLPQNLDGAARTSGHGTIGLFARVHLPLLKGSLAAAFLLVFIDILKELPASIILQPSGLQTLAVRVHHLASDERLGEAALPALMIVGVGLIPVLFLSWTIARSRPGQDMSE